MADETPRSAQERMNDTIERIAGAEQPRVRDNVEEAEAIIRAEESPNRRKTRENEEALKEAERIIETVDMRFVRLGIAWGIATLMLATLALWNGKLAIFIGICIILTIMLMQDEPTAAIDAWLANLQRGLK